MKKKMKQKRRMKIIQIKKKQIKYISYDKPEQSLNFEEFDIQIEFVI